MDPTTTTAIITALGRFTKQYPPSSPLDLQTLELCLLGLEGRLSIACSLKKWGKIKLVFSTELNEEPPLDPDAPFCINHAQELPRRQRHRAATRSLRQYYRAAINQA